MNKITFMPNGNRCLWDASGNARVVRGDYSANDNDAAWTEICERRREVEKLTREDAIKLQLISAWGRVINA